MEQDLQLNLNRELLRYGIDVDATRLVECVLHLCAWACEGAGEGGHGTIANNAHIATRHYGKDAVARTLRQEIRDARYWMRTCCARAWHEYGRYDCQLASRIPDAVVSRARAILRRTHDQLSDGGALSGAHAQASRTCSRMRCCNFFGTWCMAKNSCNVASRLVSREPEESKLRTTSVILP